MFGVSEEERERERERERGNAMSESEETVELGKRKTKIRAMSILSKFLSPQSIFDRHLINPPPKKKIKIDI